MTPQRRFPTKTTEPEPAVEPVSEPVPDTSRSRIIGGLPPEWTKRGAEERAKRKAAQKKA